MTKTFELENDLRNAVANILKYCHENRNKISEDEMIVAKATFTQLAGHCMVSFLVYMSNANRGLFREILATFEHQLEDESQALLAQIEAAEKELRK